MVILKWLTDFLENSKIIQSIRKTLMRSDDLHPTSFRDTSQASVRLIVIVRGIGVDRVKVLLGLLEI